MKTLLVAIDLSPVSSQIIKAAVDLAKPLAAKVVLVHIMQPLNSSVPLGPAMDVVALPAPYSKEELVEVKARLEKTAAPLKKAAITFSCIVKEALPVEEINRLATLHKANFIIVGSHGHGGLYHLLNGSVVTSLLKEATKPVLVVPAHAKKK